MKHIIVASLVTVATLFGGYGCVSDRPGSATEEAPVQTSLAPAASEEAAQTAGEETEQAPTGDLADEAAPAAEAEPEPLQGEILPASDDRAIETTDLAALDNWRLTLARNEIFARHGRTFKNQHIREHFEKLPWYSPNANYNDAWLSAIERQNADRILAYQRLSYEIPAHRP